MNSNIEKMENIDRFTDIEFNDDVERELYHIARIGIAAQDFLKSKIGRFISKRALDERQQILEELLEADPNNGNNILRLQFEAKITTGIIEWLSDAIEAGIQSEKDLSQT